MPRAISWSSRIAQIRNDVAHSKKECWECGDIKDVFQVELSTAKELMKTIGDVQKLRAFIFRERLLDFLDQMAGAEDLYAAVRNRKDDAKPIPFRKPLENINLDDDSSVITADQLPANVSLEPGRLVITGSSAQEIYRGASLFARAAEFDPMGVDGRLDPLPEVPSVQDDELKAMFADLRAREAARKRPSS